MISYNRKHWPTDVPEPLRGLDPGSQAATDAVAAWQRAHGLPVDGWLSPATLASMRNEAPRKRRAKS